MEETVLVLNAGSSSFKFQLFTIENATPQRKLRGQIEGIGVNPRGCQSAGRNGDLKKLAR